MDIQPFSQDAHSLATSDPGRASRFEGDKKAESANGKKSDVARDSASVTGQKQQNSFILQAAIDVNIGAGNDSVALVLKAALEGVNAALKETMGDNAIQTAYESGLDVSPEATAQRIVSLSTAFFGRYLELHSEMGEDEARSAFTEIIRGGIDTGFADARRILSGLNVLQGEIADNIDLTYELVQRGLDSFADGYE